MSWSETRPRFKSQLGIQKQFNSQLAVFYFYFFVDIRNGMRCISYVFRNEGHISYSTIPYLPCHFFFFFFFSMPSLPSGFPLVAGISCLHLSVEKRNKSCLFWQKLLMEAIDSRALSWDIKVQQWAHLRYYFMDSPIINSMPPMLASCQHVSAVFNSSVTTNLCC